MYDDYRRGSGILGAFILGGLMGAILGILFAPRSGKETREIISERAEEYWGEGVEMYNTGVEKGKGYYEKGKETASATADATREKIDVARARLQEQVGKTTDAARDKVVEIAPSAKGAIDKAADVANKGVDAVVEKAAKKDAPADVAAPMAEALPDI